MTLYIYCWQYRQSSMTAAAAISDPVRNWQLLLYHNNWWRHRSFSSCNNLLRRKGAIFTSSCHLCFLLLILLITYLLSDHVIMTCHFLPSKRFCLKIVSLCELSLSTNSLSFLFLLNMFDSYWLFKI